jgi:hypothetical protein
MHEYTAPGWRQTFDRHHAALAGELTSQLDAELASAVSAERERGIAETLRAVGEERARAANEAGRAAMEANEARRRVAESLNQTLRRIRQTTAEHETLQLVLEESALSAERVVVLLIESNQARIASWRGAALRGDEEEAAAIDLREAAAIASCVESRDPLVALAAPAEISPILAKALDSSGTGKVYLFPITARLNTVAVMLACGEVSPAPIELLCEAAGMKLESFETQVAAQEVAAPEATTVIQPLVQIAGVSNGRVHMEDAAATWTKLTAEEQTLHLRAQRTARVRVAQIRISESEALRKGARSGNVYGALRPSIDAARAEYKQSYMSQTPTMVDYLHLEIIRSLAHQDDRVMGPDYPGPIA